MNGPPDWLAEWREWIGGSSNAKTLPVGLRLRWLDKFIRASRVPSEAPRFAAAAPHAKRSRCWRSADGGRAVVLYRLGSRSAVKCCEMLLHCGGSSALVIDVRIFSRYEEAGFFFFVCFVLVFFWAGIVKQAPACVSSVGSLSCASLSQASFVLMILISPGSRLTFFFLTWLCARTKPLERVVT